MHRLYLKRSHVTLNKDNSTELQTERYTEFKCGEKRVLESDQYSVSRHESLHWRGKSWIHLSFNLTALKGTFILWPDTQDTKICRKCAKMLLMSEHETTYISANVILTPGGCPAIIIPPCLQWSNQVPFHYPPT